MGCYWWPHCSWYTVLVILHCLFSPYTSPFQRNDDYITDTDNTEDNMRAASRSHTIYVHNVPCTPFDGFLCVFHLLGVHIPLSSCSSLKKFCIEWTKTHVNWHNLTPMHSPQQYSAAHYKNVLLQGYAVLFQCCSHVSQWKCPAKLTIF